MADVVASGTVMRLQETVPLHSSCPSCRPSALPPPVPALTKPAATSGDAPRRGSSRPPSNSPRNAVLPTTTPAYRWTLSRSNLWMRQRPWLAPWERPKARDAAKLCLDSWPPHTVKRHRCVSSSCAGKICYAAVANQYTQQAGRPRLCTSWALPDGFESGVVLLINVGFHGVQARTPVMSNTCS